MKLETTRTKAVEVPVEYGVALRRHPHQTNKCILHLKKHGPAQARIHPRDMVFTYVARVKDGAFSLLLRAEAKHVATEERIHHECPPEVARALGLPEGFVPDGPNRSHQPTEEEPETMAPNTKHRRTPEAQATPVPTRILAKDGPEEAQEGDTRIRDLEDDILALEQRLVDQQAEFAARDIARFVEALPDGKDVDALSRVANLAVDAFTRADYQKFRRFAEAVESAWKQ
jgi:hypothetical protein